MAEKRPVRKSVDEPEQQQLVAGEGARRRNHGSSTSLTLNPGFRLCHTSEGSDAESDRGVCQKLRSLTLGRRYKSKSLDGPEASTSEGSKEKRKGRWNLKFNYKIRGGATESTDLPETGGDSSCSCVCTGYRRTEEHHLGAGVVFDSTSGLLHSSTSSRGGGSSSSSSESSRTRHGNPAKAGKSNSKRSTAVTREPVIDFSKFNPDDYPTEDCDEKARAQRAWEMEEGVDPPPGYNPNTSEEVESRFVELRERHSFLIPFVHPLFPISHSPRVSVFTRSLVQSGSSVPGAEETQLSRISTDSFQQLVHSQVDYIHCLVPDLLEISNCGFYWGKMDRYEAERLLENKPEGTFLLRDSAQEDYLFSVSFRRYGRSLHARIEQWNHKFSFDSHDPGVFSSDTVCGLIEHYKDPSCCMFFEPMLTLPLYRTFTFLLQHLCRSAICRMVTYDGVNQLQLPKPLKAYLKEYHYKQRVRLRRLDVEQ